MKTTGCRDIISTVIREISVLSNQAPGLASRRQILAATVGLGALVTAGCRSLAATPAGPPPTLAMLLQPHPVATVQDLVARQTTAAAQAAGARLSIQALAPDVLQSKLASTTAAGQPPDLALVGSGDVAPLAARGILRDVRDALDRIVGLNGELFPPLRALATNGPFVDRSADAPTPVWAIPYLSLGGAWLVRQDLLSQNGLPPPASFDDVRATAAKLTSRENGKFGWGAALPVGAAVDGLARAALLGHGAQIFDTLGLRIALDPGAAATGLEAVANLWHGADGLPTAPEGVVNWSDARLETAFISGSVVQTIDFGGLYARIVSKQPDLRAAIQALPPPRGPKGWFTDVPTTFLAILRRGKDPDRAVSLVERLLQPGPYDQLTRAGEGSVIPPYAYLTRGPFWDDDPNYPAFAANARGDPARDFQFAPLGYPAAPTLPAAVVQAANVLAKALRSVVDGETPASTAADTLKQQAETLAREALAMQPKPAPTPAPFWTRLFAPTSTPRRG